MPTPPSSPAARRRTAPPCACLMALLAAVACTTHTLAEPRADMTVMLQMADGVRLATDVYLPRDGEAWPVRLVRTPYGRVRYNREYGRHTDHGYAVVLQDVRGRFDSEGKGFAFLDCGWTRHRDGVETIAWIRDQPWCNGRISTEGASAMGITQYLVAAADPPTELVAQSISVAAPSLYHHAAYFGGAHRVALTVGWLSGGRWHPDNLWLTALHPFYDDHYRGLDAVARAERVHLPAIHYGGWFDVFQQGTLDGFTSRQHHGGPGAAGTQKLIIGPWGHGESRDRRIGELQFPPNALEWQGRGNAWFDHYLKGVDNGVDRLPAVQYYTMGAIGERGAPGNVWRTADDWPVPSTPTPFYLHADGTLSPDPPGDGEGGRAYTYDPRDPAPTRGGCVLTLPAGPYDQREIEARPDVITFTTPPLDEPLEVTGRLTAVLVITSDRVDTDFAVRLTDVYPDGRSMLIADGLARCRYRRGLDRLAPLEPGTPTEIEVDLWSTSIIFNQGHRIRVSITSSNYPRFDVNPNTGWPAWPMGPMLTARNEILCDRTHASHIVLPVIAE